MCEQIMAMIMLKGVLTDVLGLATQGGDSPLSLGDERVGKGWGGILVWSSEQRTERQIRFFSMRASRCGLRL